VKENTVTFRRTDRLTNRRRLPTSAGRGQWTPPIPDTPHRHGRRKRQLFGVIQTSYMRRPIFHSSPAALAHLSC